MAVFVNYYPCSYGESLVNMFGKAEVTRSKEIIEASVPTFKFTDFYLLNVLDREKILQDSLNDFYPCHRQNAIEFSGHDTISVVLDVLDFLPARYQKVHLPKLKNFFGNSKLNLLVNKIPFDRLVFKDYEIWSKTNILKNDKILMFSWIVNDNARLKNFCEEHNFFYDQLQIDEIKKDYRRWVQ